MNRYQRVLRALGRTRAMAWFGRNVVTPIDKRLHGRKWSLTTFGTDLPMGYLTTTGRRSGQPRTVPLLYVVPDGAVAAVAGTNFGTAAHPDWVGNLDANPDAVWRTDADVTVRARRASNEERDWIWPRLVEVWPGYEGYVARSQRVPEIFVLETPN